MARINRTGMRADKFMITNILNMKRPDGTFVFPPQESRLRKEVERTTMTCPECGTEGRYDDAGEIVCDDPTCAVVLTDSEEEPLIYPEDDYSAANNQGASANRGASGHPMKRTPALSPAGPQGGK